jgi:hypothetical protein
MRRSGGTSQDFFRGLARDHWLAGGRGVPYFDTPEGMITVRICSRNARLPSELRMANISGGLDWIEAGNYLRPLLRPPTSHSLTVRHIEFSARVFAYTFGAYRV